MRSDCSTDTLCCARCAPSSAPSSWRWWRWWSWWWWWWGWEAGWGVVPCHMGLPAQVCAGGASASCCLTQGPCLEHKHTHTATPAAHLSIYVEGVGLLLLVGQQPVEQHLQLLRRDGVRHIQRGACAGHIARAAGEASSVRPLSQRVSPGAPPLPPAHTTTLRQPHLPAPPLLTQTGRSHWQWPLDPTWAALLAAAPPSPSRRARCCHKRRLAVRASDAGVRATAAGAVFVLALLVRYRPWGSPGIVMFGCVAFSVG
jgi:hypothetical protein